MYQAFCNGGFVVQETCRPFSATAHDQARELCNAIVKGNGGAAGLGSSPGALKRWVTTGPQIACLLKSFEYSMTSRAVQIRHRINRTVLTLTGCGNRRVNIIIALYISLVFIVCVRV